MNESSKETEMKELQANSDAVIAKPERLLRDKEITDLYKRFKGQIDKIKEDEERELEIKLE